MASRKNSSWSFSKGSDDDDDDDGAFAVVELKILESAWFTKKAPQKLAQNKKRWFQMNTDEIRYYAKADANGNGVPGDLKGAVGLFKSTTARADGHTLIVSNPDREWTLVAANSDEGKRQAEVWARRINQLSGNSGNDGYEPGEDLYENPQTVCDAAAEPKQLSRFGRKGSAYGFDADEDADAKGGAAGGAGSNAPWYATFLDDNACNDAVVAGGPGSYLVRLSSSPGIAYVLLVNDGGSVIKFPIRQAGEEFVLGGDTTGHDLGDLMSNAKATSLQSPGGGSAAVHLEKPVGEAAGPTAVPEGMSAAEAVKQCLAGKPNAVKGKITGMVPGLAVQVRSQQCTEDDMFLRNARKHEWDSGLLIAVDKDGTCQIRLPNGDEVWLPQSALCKLEQGEDLADFC